MSQTEALRQQEIELTHHNALKQRQKWCEWCRHAVPREDYSTKFAQAGGVLAGPFCSDRCYWDFIRTNEFHDVTPEERREFYRSEDDE